MSALSSNLFPGVDMDRLTKSAWKLPTWPDGTPKSLDNHFTWDTGAVSIFRPSATQQQTAKAKATQERNKEIAKALRVAQRDNSSSTFNK